MLSTFAVCATAFFFATDPSVRAQPVPTPQASAPTPIAKSMASQGTVFNPKDVAPQGKKAGAKPEQKTGQRFELLAIEQSVFDSTNAERARFGLPAFVVDPNLMATARQHCAWMTTYRQLVHTNIAVAENIAMGQRSTQEVLQSWMNSSGHRANILNRGHRRIGVAAYRTPEGTIFWCQQFAP
jgi:uncharacterized protein YkwD